LRVPDLGGRGLVDDLLSIVGEVRRVKVRRVTRADGAFSLELDDIDPVQKVCIVA
jgi:hypothetical protein